MQLRVDTAALTGAAPTIASAAGRTAAGGPVAVTALALAAAGAGQPGLSAAVERLAAATSVAHDVTGAGVRLLAAIAAGGQVYADSDQALAADLRRR